MTDLVTVEEYKAYKDINNPENEGQLQNLITQVSALVENYCNRKFVEYYSSPYRTEWSDGKVREYYVRHFPLVSVISVKTSADGGLTQTELTEDAADGTGYFVDLENDRILTQNDDKKFIDTYNLPYRSLEVTYQAGYDIDQIPEDLKLCVFDLVEYYNEEQKHPTKTLLGATIDNPLPTISSQFPPHIKRILDLYRLST